MEGSQTNSSKNKAIYRLSPRIICDICLIIIEYIWRRDIVSCFFQVIKVIVDDFGIYLSTGS